MKSSNNSNNNNNGFASVATSGATVATSGATLGKWISIRQDLYQQIQSYVHKLLGGESAELLHYRKEYEKEFNKKWQISQRKNLVQLLNQKKIIFLGDFHALQQSQKAHLRILKSIKPVDHLVLAVEFFKQSDQKHVDNYLAGKYSDKEFLKCIEWQKTWGFPWEYYKPIIKWAIKNKVPVLALNTDHKKLKKRDQLSAQKIAEVIGANPQIRMLVIYGDLHLAEGHLPAQVSKKLKLNLSKEALIIYQNSEKIYFQLLKQSQEHSVDLVKISEYKYCLINVPPWVKWQSYLLYLEQNYDIGSDEEDFGEMDYTDYVVRYANILAADFEIRPKFDHVSIYSASDSDFWGQVEGLGAKEKKWLQSYIQNGVSFYIPQLGVGFLARTTVNHAASMAMAIIHQQLSGHQIFAYNMPKDFLRLVWQEAVQYFGSKFINPKRKTDTLADIRLSLAAGLTYNQGIEALNLALRQKMKELLYLSGAQKMDPVAPVRQLISYREAARLLGGMLGEKLYFAYRSRLISKASLQSILRKSIEEKNFDQIYYEIVELIESFPEPFQSKSEKL